MLSLTFTACAPHKMTLGEINQPTLRLPFVRALISDTESDAIIGSQNTIAIECLRGADRFVYYSPRSVHLRVRSGSLQLLGSKNEVIEDGLDQVTVSPRDFRYLLTINQRPYRGLLRIAPIGGAMTVINTLFVEDYLKGVVPPEIGPVSEVDEEAIKAQAVAARTYTMSRLGQYGALAYDVKSDVSDQVYTGASAETDLISKAVDATTGEVARYKGDFIHAYYHSTCGGHTDYIQNVWPKPAEPYLVAVDCREMCSASKYYRWTETFTGTLLAKHVSDYETSTRGKPVTYHKITDIFTDNSSAFVPNKGLRTQKLVVMADGKRLEYTRDNIRWVVRRASDPNKILQSDFFDLDDIQHDHSGAVTSVTFRGAGYGHGVGMCQMGALGMARAQKGFSYRDILTRYYTGIDIDKLY